LITGAVSIRYAKALFNLAVEKNLLEQVHTDLHDFAELLQQFGLLRAIFYSPEAERSAQEQLLNELLTDKTPEIFLNFLKLLVQKNRQSIFKTIVQEFDRLYNHSKNQVVATVWTAVPMDEDIRSNVVHSLKKSLHADILLNAQVDEKLLGGMVVEAGGNLIDFSLKRKLEELKKQLDPSLKSRV
jgi:F-type H+-transporting ATPase subunit delta